MYEKVPQMVRKMTCPSQNTKVATEGSISSAEENSVSITNTIIPQNTDVPVGKLITLNGKVEGQPVRFLTDDGCNNNVVSKECAGWNLEKFTWVESNLEVCN